jgi:HSP20 family protein
MAEDMPQPWRPFFPVQEEVRRLFQELIYQPWGRQDVSQPGRWQPHVDICETAEAIIIEVELPGVRREDVRIEVEGDSVRITGERRIATQRQGRNYYHLEQSFGRFARQLRLPYMVDREAIRAEFDAGILTLTLPKRGARQEGSGDRKGA